MLQNHISNRFLLNCRGGGGGGGGLFAKSCPTLATPWTVAHQAPLSMEFSRQEYWSGLPFPSPLDFTTQGWNPGLLHCRQILYHLSYQENFIINQD